MIELNQREEAREKYLEEGLYMLLRLKGRLLEDRSSVVPDLMAIGIDTNVQLDDRIKEIEALLPHNNSHL